MKKSHPHKKLIHHLDKMGEHHKAAVLHVKELARNEKLEAKGKAEVKKSSGKPGRPRKDSY